MRIALYIVIAAFVIVGCSENPQVASLRESLARVDSVGAIISEMPLDSVVSVQKKLSEAKDEIKWLGADSSVTFIREDAAVINELSKASRWLKDSPARIVGMSSEVERCVNQIEGLIVVIESGATIDAKGDTIDAEYLSENVAREIEAVENLVEYFNESDKYMRLGLESDRDSWDAIDSLLTAKRALWARGIAGEDLNSEEK